MRIAVALALAALVLLSVPGCGGRRGKTPVFYQDDSTDVGGPGPGADGGDETVDGSVDVIEEPPPADDGSSDGSGDSMGSDPGGSDPSGDDGGDYVDDTDDFSEDGW